MHRQAARRARRLAGALTLAVAACADAAPPEPVVVEVAAQPCDTPNRDLGLGVVIDDDLVATAAHTVEGPRRSITVDGAPAEVVALDARTDLALLAAEIDDGPAALSEAAPPSARLLTNDGEQPVEIVRTGDLVVHDATDGTTHRRQVHTFTPPVDEGTSGAPLVDTDGRVLGVVVLANRGDGTAYAVTAAELAGVDEPGPAATGCPG